MFRTTGPRCWKGHLIRPLNHDVLTIAAGGFHTVLLRSVLPIPRLPVSDCAPEEWWQCDRLRKQSGWTMWYSIFGGWRDGLPLNFWLEADGWRSKMCSWGVMAVLLPEITSLDGAKIHDERRKECHTPRLLQAIIIQCFFEVLAELLFVQWRWTMWYSPIETWCVISGLRRHTRCFWPRAVLWGMDQGTIPAGNDYISNAGLRPLGMDRVLQINLRSQSDATSVIFKCTDLNAQEVFQLISDGSEMVFDLLKRMARELNANLHSLHFWSGMADGSSGAYRFNCVALIGLVVGQFGLIDCTCTLYCICLQCAPNIQMKWFELHWYVLRWYFLSVRDHRLCLAGAKEPFWSLTRRPPGNVYEFRGRMPYYGGSHFG